MRVGCEPARNSRSQVMPAIALFKRAARNDIVVDFVAEAVCNSIILYVILHNAKNSQFQLTFMLLLLRQGRGPY